MTAFVLWLGRLAAILALLFAAPAHADADAANAAPLPDPGSSARVIAEPATMSVPSQAVDRAAVPVTHGGRPKVEVVAAPGLEDVGAKLAAGADATLARIAGDLVGLPTPARIELRVVREAEDLAKVAPAGRGAPPWAVGVAYPDLGIISIALRRGHEVLDADATMRHELAHLALGAALGPRAPRWLHEGFAYQHSAEWTWSRTETLAGLAWFGGIAPLDQLDASFPAEESPAHRAYAQSYDFVGFLSRRGYFEDDKDDGDRRPFRTFLAEIAHGATPDAAAAKSFGRPLRFLFDEWKSDLNRRFRLIPLGLLGLAAWCVVAILVVAAWWRRKRANRRRLAQWDADDAARAAAAAAEAPLAPSTGGTQVIAPPYVPWPGEDPFDVDPDDEPKRNPRLLN
ncbi:MAG: hypothetical protein KF773_25365 [Deltaproteobacteria bacterium]|nr:hypothetical protein [Deltaproteobacteria bacterium]